VVYIVSIQCLYSVYRVYSPLNVDSSCLSTRLCRCNGLTFISAPTEQSFTLADIVLLSKWWSKGTTVGNITELSCKASLWCLGGFIHVTDVLGMWSRCVLFPSATRRSWTVYPAFVVGCLPSLPPCCRMVCYLRIRPGKPPVRLRTREM